MNWEKQKLEDEATLIIKHARKDVKKISEKQDVLSPEQLDLRMSREVLSDRGFPDPSVFRGMYRREYNPQFGRRPRRYSHASDPWRQDMYESFTDRNPDEE